MKGWKTRFARLLCSRNFCALLTNGLQDYEMDLTDTLWIDSKDEEDHIRVKAVKFNKRMAGASIIGANELDDGLEVSSGSCSIVHELIYFKVPIFRFQI